MELNVIPYTLPTVIRMVDIKVVLINLEIIVMRIIGK